MRKTTVGFVLAFAVVWLGQSANQRTLGLQRVGTSPHRVHSDTTGCRTVDGLFALTQAAIAMDTDQWQAVLSAGNCTRFYKGDRVVLELRLVDIEGIVKIHRQGETASYYAFAVAID
jgi:hypothetical protein